MEVLSPSQIVSLCEREKEDLLLPATKNISSSPIEKELRRPKIGAIFQKVCSSCQSPSKYQCPKCSVLSCSVKCVKAHKAEKNCDGVREKTAFVAIEDFKDTNLHSDFHFLEDARRNIEIAHRGKKGNGLMHGLLPHNLYRLQMAARLRKTDLHILPLMFSKRKRSTTYFRYCDKKIFWRIEWEFPHVEYACSEERVDEDMVLGDCLDKYVKKQSSNTDATSDEKLAYYHSLEPRDIAVLLKDENCPANVIRYHWLDQSKTLKTNFRHKKIIEYPMFLVVSKLHLSCYQIAY